MQEHYQINKQGRRHTWLVYCDSETDLVIAILDNDTFQRARSVPLNVAAACTELGKHV